MKRERAHNTRILNAIHRAFCEAAVSGLVELRRVARGHSGDHGYVCCDVFQLFLCLLSCLLN
jgi:hypothetical protein